jgi:subtilisin family serine protease/PKD repeat protein
MKHLLILIILFIPFLSDAQDKLDKSKCAERLLEALDQSKENEFVKAYLLLEDRVDIFELKADLDRRQATLEERSEEVIPALQKKAAQTQGDLLEWLSEVGAQEIRAMWITNVVFADLRPADLAAASRRVDVAWIGLNAPLEPELHEVGETGISLAPPDGAEPGLKAINAHKMWELGYTGYGRKSFTSDTGVDPSHPALSGKYLGAYVPADQAWYQYNSGNKRPFDCGYHGTHVTGTILGLDRQMNDTIGVAFNALWMGGPTLCGVGTADNVEAFEWCVDPDGDPSTIDDMPDVVNNSWYDPGLSGGNDCQSMYTDVLTALEAVGVAVVFSAGNEGPGESTITPPKNINVSLVNTFAVGALNGNNSIAGFSSNGPSVCPDTGSLAIKPEVSAPGVNVRSCLPDNEYGLLSGTSMAAPHVAGAILLLKEAFPYLTGEDLKMALYTTCTDLGESGEDNTFGMGIINVYAAWEKLVADGNLPVPPIAAQRDLMPVRLDVPAVNCDNAWTPVLTVRNDGFLPVGGFQVSLTIDLPDPIILANEWTDTLQPGEQKTLHFPMLTDLPAGRHTVQVEVKMAGGSADDRPLNDRLYTRVLISNQVTASARWEQLSTLKACAGKRALLTSPYQGLGVVRWYDAPLDGNLLAEGSEFVTPPLSQDTTYYAEVAWSGGGITDFIPDLATEPASLDKGLVIFPETDMNIVGCYVYAAEKTGCVIQIRDFFTDELLDQQSFLLEPGKNFLDFNIDARSGDPLVFIHKFGKPLMYMEQTPEFPYEYGDFYSITGAYEDGEVVTDKYYFFYDWEIAFEEICNRNAVSVEVGGPGDLPVADFTLSDSIVYLDQGGTISATHQASGGFGYLWRFGDGTSSILPSPSHTYQEEGLYTVSLQVAGVNGCTDASSKTIRVRAEELLSTSTGGPVETAPDPSWFLFPNPATSSVTVVSSTRAAAFTLLDPTGRVVQQWPALAPTGAAVTLELESISPGIYFLRMITPDGLPSVRRLLIQKP